jgi:FkbM family methyltransferase
MKQGKTNYNKFFKYIDNSKVNTVFEVGSRDCLDGITLLNTFKSETHCFECNPNQLEECKENIKGVDNIYLCEKAVYDQSGLNMEFTVPVKMPGDFKSWNGVGSLNGELTKEWWARNNHSYQHCDNTEIIYDKVSVESITLKQYCIENNITNVDLICLDVEGVSLRVLKGLEDYIDNVTYVVSEVVKIPAHGDTDDDLFEDLNNYLLSKGFELTFEEVKSKVFGNAIWTKK